MGVKLHNSNFTSGELSPLLEGRINFERYNKGATKLQNVLILPQGGLTNRFGTIFNVNLGALDYTNVNIGVLNYNDEIKYTLVFLSREIKIYLDANLKATVVTTYLESEIGELIFKQDGNIIEIVHGQHAPALLERDDVDDTVWTLSNPTFKNKPVFDFTNDYDDFTFQPSVTIGYDITLTSAYIGVPPTRSFFSERHVGGIFEGNKGVMRITTLVDGNTVKGNVFTPFNNTNTIAGKDSYVAEPVFSDLRGWPKSLDFYQGRQFYGGTPSIEDGVFGSATFDAFNYDATGETPSDAISIILAGDNTNKIKSIIDSKDLFVLTTTAEYSTPPFTDKPASPVNTYFVKQSNHGMSDVGPVILDDKLIIIDKGGKIVRAMVYDVNRAKYTTSSVSLLSPQLIKNPVSVATFENPEIEDASYMLLINEDGTMAIFLFIEDQEIAAWTSSVTDGKFRQVVSSGSEVVFLIQRTENEQGQEVENLFIEKLTFEFLFDSSVDFTFGSPQTVISGLSHLNGKTIKIIGDDKLLADEIVNDGTVTLEEAITNFKAGLPIEWEVNPMPAQYQTEVGNNLYSKKRIRTIYLDYYLSLGIKVQGKLIPNLKFNTDSFGDDLVPKTGVYEYANMSGWKIGERVVISGNEPLKFNIRSITYEVEQ